MNEELVYDKQTDSFASYIKALPWLHVKADGSPTAIRESQNEDESQNGKGDVHDTVELLNSPGIYAAGPLKGDKMCIYQQVFIHMCMWGFVCERGCACV